MTLISKIQSWCDDSLVKLVSQYDTDGRRASGNWEDELDSKVEQNDRGFTVQILGAYYSFWMENGRKQGKFPPIAAIRQWIEDKGIIADGISRDSLAFLIARKISREGYQGKPTIASVMTDQWIRELVDTVGMYYVQNLRSDVVKTLTA